MCRINLAVKLSTAIAACFAAAFLLNVQPVFADNPVGCTDSSAQLDIGLSCTNTTTGASANITSGTPLIQGQKVIIRLTVFKNPGDAQCARQGGTIRSIFPNCVTNDVLSPVPLICGDVTFCNPLGIPSLTVKSASYTVDIANTNNNCATGDPCNPGFIKFGGTWVNAVSCCAQQCESGVIDTCFITPVNAVCHPVLVPSLRVQKDVVCTTEVSCPDKTSSTYVNEASGAISANATNTFCYRVIVHNNGTAPLIVDTVTDDGAIPAGDIQSAFAGSLAVGASKTNTFGPFALTATDTNTVTANAHAVATGGCENIPVSNSDKAIANVIPSDISCAVSFIQGGDTLSGDAGCGSACNPPASIVITPGNGTVTVRVRVTNNGQQNVSGTVTVNAQDFAFGPVAPAASVNVNTVTVNGDTIGCHEFTADVVASGAKTDDCPPITTMCSGRFEICGVANVCIIKLVKCADTNECLGGICTNDLSQYAPSATGVAEALFCYGIAIENCGELTLTNVCVTDTQLSPVNCLAGFPTTLTPGQSATNFFQKSYSTPIGTPIRNVATVLGQSIAGDVTASSNAVVNLLQPGINCTKQVSLNGGAYNAGGSVDLGTLNEGECLTNSVTFRVIVRNTGNVDLENVKIIDVGTAGCDAETNTVPDLPVGGIVTQELCTVSNIVLCCLEPTSATINNRANVSGEVSDEVCSIDMANCQRIVTSNACDNSITLSIDCIRPVACRTTGGGKQFSTCQTNSLGTTESTVPTYVTHGGQVGASVGVAIVFSPNTPCIRGEWTHVRHVSPKLRGNFHAASNGRRHDFDSLQCACLDCADSGATTVVRTLANHSGTSCVKTDLNYNAATDLEVIDGICNGRNKAGCGNWPAPSPANKICFSGAGKYTRINSKRDENVVFRVDVEDRSEPGGSHPGGQASPPDRYRFRLWIIKGNALEGGPSGNPNTSAALELRRRVACQDPHIETLCARLPDIDDGGDLERGNRQLHKSTGAKPPTPCPDGRGCDPFD